MSWPTNGTEAPVRRAKSDIISITVGETKFTTTRATLRGIPGTTLECLVRTDPVLPDGSYFIDHDPIIFAEILLALRTDVTVPRAVPRNIGRTQEQWDKSLAFYRLNAPETEEDPYLMFSKTAFNRAFAAWILRSDPFSRAHETATIIACDTLDLRQQDSSEAPKYPLILWKDVREFNSLFDARVLGYHFGPYVLDLRYVASTDWRLSWPEVRHLDCLGKDRGPRFTYPHTPTSDTYVMLLAIHPTSIKDCDACANTSTR